MSITKSILIFLILIVSAFAGGTTYLMNHLLSSGFRELEKREAQENAERVINFFLEQQEQLGSKAHDWSIWDDLFNYANGTKPDFPKTNITKEAITALNIDFIGIQGTAEGTNIAFSLPTKDGNIVASNEKMDLIKKLVGDFEAGRTDVFKNGIYLIEGKPMFISARANARSDTSGPSPGILYFGLTVTKEILTNASHTVKMDIAEVQKQDPIVETAKNSTDIETNRDNFFNFYIGENPISFMTPSADLQHILISLTETPHGKQSTSTDQPPQSALKLLVKNDRDIMRLGTEVSSKVTILVTALAFVGWSVFFVIVWNVAIGRIQNFEKKMQHVTQLNQETIEDIQNFSRDGSKNEIDKLAHSVGQMLKRAHDVESERDKAQKDLMYASKMASIGEMAGGIAHEINNPLTVIAGRARQIRMMLMADKLTKQNGESLVDSIEKTTQRIANIVKALRTHSRSNDTDEMHHTNITHVIDGTIDLCREQLHERSIKIKSIYPENIPNIPCKEVQIGQVILNLVKNAMDAIESLPNNEDRWIKVEIAIDQNPNGNCRIMISNGGPLIPDKVKARLFQPFFTTKPVGKGTGLGLSISASLLHQQNGNLTLKEDSVHTCFVLTIPLVTTLPLASDSQSKKAG